MFTSRRSRRRGVQALLDHFWELRDNPRGEGRVAELIAALDEVQVVLGRTDLTADEVFVFHVFSCEFHDQLANIDDRDNGWESALRDADAARVNLPPRWQDPGRGMFYEQLGAFHSYQLTKLEPGSAQFESTLDACVTTFEAAEDLVGNPERAFGIRVRRVQARMLHRPADTRAELRQLIDDAVEMSGEAQVAYISMYLGVLCAAVEDQLGGDDASEDPRHHLRLLDDGEDLYLRAQQLDDGSSYGYLRLEHLRMLLLREEITGVEHLSYTEMQEELEAAREHGLVDMVSASADCLATLNGRARKRFNRIDPELDEMLATASWDFLLEIRRSMSRRHDPRGHAKLARRWQGAASLVAHLLRVGRLEDAFHALEFSRGMMWTLRSAPLPGALVQRAHQNGYEQEVGEFVAAQEDLASEERRLYGTGVVLPGEPEAGLDAARRASARVDAARAALLGRFPDGWLPVPAVSDVVAALRGDVLVYLGAGSPTGFALLVLPSGQLRRIVIPALTSDTLYWWNEWLERSLAGDDGTWDRLLNDIGEVVAVPLLAEVRAVVPDLAGMVVVPLGSLAKLPLHAAIVTDVDGFPVPLVDVMPIRYAVNAQTLTSPRRWCAAGDNVLVASAPEDGDGNAEHVLWFAEEEADLIGEVYGSSCDVVKAATPAEVLSRLATADVWHLVCHGTADQVDVLESQLHLHGGSLRLHEAIARAGRSPSVAVLAACRSGNADATRLDEVVGFPGALISRGAGTVVSTLWDIDDAASALLMFRFHQHLHAGAGPGEALVQAQRWFRRASRRDLLQWLGRGKYERFFSGVEWATDAELDQRPFEHPSSWAAFTCYGS